MSTNEFARPIRLDVLGPGPRDFDFAAGVEERTALARRFALVSIDRLEVTAAVRREGPGAYAEGRVAAEVVQSCVATDVPIPARIDVPFTLRFVPEGAEAVGDEVELSEDDCDTVEFTGSAIDLGEAAAETLVLSLDPFPRAAGADAVLREAGVLEEGEAGPFAALKALKDKLGE